MQVQRQIDRLLAQRAAEWIETLKSGDARDRKAFVQWLRQSKLHVEQYLEMVAIDRELQQLDPAQSEDVDALLKRIAPNVVQLDEYSLTPAPLRSRQRVTRKRLWQVGAALAASVTLCFALLPRNNFETAVGEQRTLTLADGSVVALNTASAIEVDFSRGARNITLTDGEAVFKVAPDRARPFVVHTRNAEVHALGTQFNVYQRREGALVSVLEGRVQVRAHRQGEPVQESLAAGEEAQIQPDGQIERRAHPDVNKSLAWRQRQLFFDETPLEDMVREFNRYGRSVQIRLEGIESGSRRYGGLFDADDPNSLADLLAREPDLTVEKHANEILIRKRRTATR